MLDDIISPKDPAEAVALHRAQVIGPLVAGALDRGDLRAAMEVLSKQPFRSPRRHSPQTYSVSTLERWYYAFRERGLEGLRPQPRSDRGRGRDLTAEQKELLLDIRRENPKASVALIVRTLVADGRLERGAVQPSTVRRFFAEHGLDRDAMRVAGVGRARLRWQAERPGHLWHADVCHAVILPIAGGASVPVRIHALLDDASRYVVALEAMYQEREVDMLAVLVRALSRYAPPGTLYLDNGATYRGESLALACARLGTALVHARPYDAPARGKMERFWRTLREQCLSVAGTLTTLHDLNVRLLAWLDEHYHRAPHGGLLGKTPEQIFATVPAEPIEAARLRDALTVRDRRRVRRDNTVAIDGKDWETDLHFLAGRLVTVAQSLAEPELPPWIEYEERAHRLRPVDPVANGKRPRTAPAPTPQARRVAFDPPRALVDRALGRRRDDEDGGER